MHCNARPTDPQARRDFTPIRRVNDDDFDVLADGAAIGRIMKAAAAPVGSPWLWTYGFDPRERRPAHGYCASREAAMAAFAKSWRRE
jgi:hypothetical protein